MWTIWPGQSVFIRTCSDWSSSAGRQESTIGNASIPLHGAFGPGHVAFSASDTELADWHGVAIERTIDWPGGGRSLYFRDPAGNSLELATPRIWGSATE
jgi:catechol 2,3-dioxygenase-like lactoylglutathione lyase family enzyme